MELLFLYSTLVVFCAFLAGVSAGVIIAGLCVAAKQDDQQFSGEHEFEAPYPRRQD
ncbi:hypothetical protein [Paraburkholderia phenazinium]|uniref:DUF3789 domain-containing protein n=1 Tax=Paraburkholderia phenazinium TaxID=60549 RepID=A0A1N6KP41_9BURK|nr:hypothetical protein [Paraburkholderia phenazinium]SIO58308.1 hypothetical protein SAMN05444165_4096 [Paraburkholderia phenazinium]